MNMPAAGRLALAALALSLAAVPAAAQESGAFIIRLGRDTVAVEQFTRTVYDAAQDLARIPVRAETAAGEPVEQLTMHFEPGNLVISWENTRVLVPITVAP
jgi:hypothetical protein